MARSTPDASAPGATASHFRLFVLLGVGVVLLGSAGAAFAVQQQVFGVRASEVTAVLNARLTAPGGTMGLHPGVESVYAARQMQPIWMQPAARDAARLLLAGATFDGIDPATVDTRAFDTQASATPTDTSLAALDLALTSAVLAYGDALVAPRADASALYGNNWFPAARDSALSPAARLADALAAPDADPAEALAAWADGLRPHHDGYRDLRAALIRETRLADGPDLRLDRDLAPGDTGRAVANLRARLAVEAEATGAAPAAGDARTFDDALAATVAAVQTRDGIAATGRLDAATRAVLNRRQADRIPTLRLNLERWRWLPDSLGALHVWVNLPTFEIVLREHTGAGWAEALRSRAVVGQRSWKTPVFSDTMESVVFNPTWMMPASIQRESYGRLRPDRALRQPGPGNALGRAKFLFPNPHAIYIHDTPSKWAFQVDDRARSHGCVRAADPRDLAVAILTRTNGWTVEQVDDAITGPWILQSVPLDRGVPVHLVYFTATADASGRVTVVDDMYGHDAPLAAALGLTLPAAGANA